MEYRASEYYRNLFDYDILFMDINTPLYILALVLIVMISLHKLLFQPILRTLDSRKAHMDELNQQTRQHHAEIEKLTNTYKERLEEVRTEVNRVRQEARRAAQGTVNGILEQARQQTGTELKAALADLESQVGVARTDLAQSANALADEAATRVLGA